MKKILQACMFALLLSVASYSAAEITPLDQGPILERTVFNLAARSSNRSISIPRTALTSRNAIPGVFVVEKGEARFRMVRPGAYGARQVEILSGLFGNEVMLNDHLDTVHDGSRITMIK